MYKILFFLLIISIQVLADNRKNESIDWDEGKPLKAKVIQGKLDEKLDLAFLNFTVEKSKLSEIRETLGPSEILKSGDASTSKSTICYFGPDKTVLKFNSGEMGGGSTITDIEVIEGENGETKCSVSQRVSRELTNGRGIKLGLTKAGVAKLLGQPNSIINSNDWGYFYESKSQAPECDGGWDVTGVYRLKFSKDKVRYFTVSKITSC